MIVYLPIALFMLGALLAYGSSGRRRQVATLVMLLAAAWSMVLLTNQHALYWAAGPLLATLLLPRPRERLASTFEVLSRRTLTIAGLVVLAFFVCAQLPVGENPLGLNVVPWLLGAVGAAWVLNPIDAAERLQGQVLMIAAVAAVILSAVPGGALTAAAAGAVAVGPLVARRWLPGRSLMSSLLLVLAAIAAVLAVSGLAIPRQSAADLTLSFAGPVLLASAVVLCAAALSGSVAGAWSGLLAALALLAAAPALRWSAIGAVVAIATANDPDGERPAWLALIALSAVPVLHALAPALVSARFQTVALGAGLVLALYAARSALLRSVALPAMGFLVLVGVSTLSSGNLTRFQWIAAAGAILLVGRALLLRAAQTAPPFVALAEPLLMGILLLATSARDPLGLGALATALLLVDLSVVRARPLDRATGNSWLGRLRLLAVSNWPPAITFAGVTLGVIAALQASLALGLLAAAMVGLLQLAPVLDSRMETEPSRAIGGWLPSAISLLSGVAPGVVLRMLRL